MLGISAGNGPRTNLLGNGHSEADVRALRELAEAVECCERSFWALIEGIRCELPVSAGKAIEPQLTNPAHAISRFLM